MVLNLFKSLVREVSKALFPGPNGVKVMLKDSVMFRTVTQLARESVGLCPLSWFVREGILVITQ